MSEGVSKILWDLLESEARERFFIDAAPEPAFLISWGIFSPKGKCTLYLNTVGAINSFPSLKKAEERIKELVESARTPIKVYKGIKRGHLLFAENKESRLPATASEGNLIATFKIREWEAAA